MFRKIRLFIAQYWKTIIWLIIVFILSTMQMSNVPKTSLFRIPHFDKIVHFSMYFISLTLSFTDAYKAKEKLLSLSYYGIAIGNILYGISIEFIQSQIPNRSADFYDALANSFGVLIAFLLFRYLNRYRTFLVRWSKII